MILLVADIVDGQRHPPPRPLRYEWDARRYRVLPYAGGLRDQPARLLNHMRACGNIYDALRAVRQAAHGSGKAWVEFERRNPAAWRIFQHVWQLRREEKHGTK